MAKIFFRKKSYFLGVSQIFLLKNKLKYILIKVKKNDFNLFY